MLWLYHYQTNSAVLYPCSTHSLGVTVSFFYNKGKTTFWKKLKAFPDVIDAFHYIDENPFSLVDAKSWFFKLLLRYTIIVYDNSSELHDINQCQMELFARKKQELATCPPTEDSMLKHTQQMIYTAGESTPYIVLLLKID